MPTGQRSVDEIFAEAIRRPQGSDRANYLDEVYGQDAAARERMERLLRAHAEAHSFLEAPAADPLPTAVHEAPLDERAGTVIGPYKLLQQIGEGGMGVVFMAGQTEPIQRTVALKIIKPGMDTRQVIARFEAERQALAVMDHPNIAKVLDAGTTDTGRPYFVMDLVKGVPITEYCDQQYLTVRQRLELMTQVCQAVQHAHQKGIIHRDLKPSNVLVAEYDGKPVPKIIDFGVAKATAQRLTERTMFTQYGQIVGTFEYMSPEQARFNQLDIDTRSDIYSLGVVLYELLAGSTPLEKERLRSAAFDEILRIIGEEEPPKPSTRLSSSESLPSIAANRRSEPARLSKDVRGELDWIVMKCLEKDRNRRYETASALSIDLQHFLHDEAVTACPPSAVYRFRKFVRRNKTALAIAALVLFFLVLLGGGVGWAVRDRSVRQAALEEGVNSALGEVENWYQRENWPEAMSAVKRAEGLLNAGDSMPVLDSRVTQWRSDLETVNRLEQIVLANIDTPGGSGSNGAAAETEYEREFRTLGIDINTLSVEEAAARVRQQRIRDQLNQAFDHWAHYRRTIADEQRRPHDWWRRPVAIARMADSSEFRTRVRAAIEQGDLDMLAKVAASPELRHLPGSTLRLMAQELERDAHRRDLARSCLRRAHQDHPGDFWVNFAIASQLSRSGTTPIAKDIDSRRRRQDNADAIPFWTAALALRPENRWVRIGLGQALADSGQLDESAGVLRKATDLWPDFANGHSDLANVLESQGRLEDAVSELRTAIKVSRDNQTLAKAYGNLGYTLRHLGQPKEALSALQKAVALAPQDPWSHVSLGFALLSQRRFEEAVVAYRTAVKLKPDYCEAHLNLGIALQELGKLDDAISAYHKAIDLEPGFATTYVNLGNALLEQEKHNDAVEVLQKAIDLKPQQQILANAYGTLGIGLRKLGRLDESVAAYLKSIKLQPGVAAVHGNLGIALMERRKYDDAATAFRELIRLQPDEAAAYVYLATALASQSKLGEAIAAYQQAIDRQPNNAIACDAAAFLLVTASEKDVRDPPRAVALAMRAVNLARENGKFWHTLGVARYRAGQWQPAIDALEKSLKLHAGADATDWFFLAMAHWKLGHKEDARKWYDKAVEWMAKTKLDNEELHGFRAEATELLGATESKLDSKPVPPPENPPATSKGTKLSP